jgi:multiple sugar transport system substrate-binding protein
VRRTTGFCPTAINAPGFFWGAMSVKSWSLAIATAAALYAGVSHAHAWSLSEAAAPYKGTSITVVGLDRPSYAIAQKLTPEFEKETGIKVTWNIFPYEDALKEETLNFMSSGP